MSKSPFDAWAEIKKTIDDGLRAAGFKVGRFGDQTIVIHAGYEFAVTLEERREVEPFDP